MAKVTLSQKLMCASDRRTSSRTAMEETVNGTTVWTVKRIRIFRGRFEGSNPVRRNKGSHCPQI